MITLYTWTTSNGRKATITIEETGLPYELRPVNIHKGEQLAPDYLKISPNHTIPAIIDHDAPEAPRIVFESGAVLIYLAEKSGKLLASSGRRRDQTLAWLFWAASGFAAAHGNWRQVALRTEQPDAAEAERGAKNMIRMLDVLERRLSEQPFLAEDYSIADISTFTRARNALPEFRKAAGALLGPTPAIDRWLAAIEVRPAVKRGLEIPKV
jgi:GST-like protein